MQVSPESTALKKERARIEKRSSIVRAAERVFLNQNYYHSTIEDIAHEAGYSVGTIYNFFENKEKLYIEVAAKISQEMLDILQQCTNHYADRKKGFEKLIRHRIDHYDRYRLFLHLFDKKKASHPFFDGPLPGKIVNSYHRYLTQLGAFLAAISPDEELDKEPDYHIVYLALSFEGTLNALVGYDTSSGRVKSIPKQLYFLKQMFSDRPFTLRQNKSRRKNMKATASKEIYITKHDLARLTDLIVLSRSFSDGFANKHLRNLAREINRAKIVDSREIPPDVVTMNSKVRLLNRTTQEMHIYMLVFPADDDGHPEKVSILTPLGTSLIGYRIGDCFDLESMGESGSYQIEDLLYQPESAGDYSL